MNQLLKKEEAMTVSEARKICRHYYDKTNPTDEDRFLFSETMEFLITETKDPGCMNDLGAFYYEQRQFELALKYYNMASMAGDLTATSNLGYIWYYGRTGKRDYEKAFRYFDKARQLGDLISAYKVADMYRNGYYVEKDYEKYRQIIEELYPKVKDARVLSEPLPEIYTRLARIRTGEGKTDEALALYDTARYFLARRIQGHPFFGDLNIMKWTVNDIYRLREFDPEFTDIYDLYYLTKEPRRVTFKFEEERHTLESVPEDGDMSIHFDDRWYRTIDDFFRNAEIDDELVTALFEELYDFEVK